MLLGWRRQVAKIQGAVLASPAVPDPVVVTGQAQPYTLAVVPDRHLTDVPGFKAQGVWAQIKKKSRDVCLIVSDRPSKGAAVFTQNAFCAAPVIVSRENVENGDIRAIVCNAGNANAVTGEQGLRDAREMAVVAAKALGLQADQFIVCSTGIIGRPMPMDKVRAGIIDCAKTLGEAKGGEAAEAITTTDSHPKTVFVEVKVAGRAFHIAGIAKGAGMIHPNMATMLSFLVTDAPMSTTFLQANLKEAVNATFNMITIDGDQSTNDTCALIANGAAGGANLRKGTIEAEAFQNGLTLACKVLAKHIAGDGEGASALLEVRVEGAATIEDARAIARSVAKSNLVKSALHGKDPNWGRIVAAIGAVGTESGSRRPNVDPDRVSVRFESSLGSVPVLDEGEPLGANLKDANAVLQTREVRILVTLGLGPYAAEAWGCDLSEEYVTFNSAYST
jgi:glutamate N-acetyltransferase/amino-acid N-acetyltransferase